MSVRQWLCQETAAGTVHVRPLADGITHDLSEECACGPTPEHVSDEHGTDGWLHTHHSLDGREAHE